MDSGWACGKCRTINAAHAILSGGCGREFAAEIWRCRHCGLELPSIARDCIQCGTPLSATSD